MDRLNELYDRRKYLIDVEGRCAIEDAEINSIENEICSLEYLPTFDEVIDKISRGEMKSIFQ